MAIPIVKVYAAGNSIVIDMVNGVTYVVAPVNLATKYVRRNNYTIYDDRVSLFIVGQNYTGFCDKFPDAIRDETGNRLVSGRDQTIDDVEAYFNLLGIGQQAGGGYTKLNTPIVAASSITQSGATITWLAIANAYTYDIKDSDNNLITNTSILNYTFSGLTAGTPYTYYVIAKGSGLYLDSDPGIISFITTAIPVPGQPQLSPSFQLTPSTALY